jgi:hypothetical protein
MSGQVNGTFIYDGQPRNGATAKLWQATGFGSPPAFDAAEPSGGYQVGSTLTTGTDYGGDGSYRWTSVPDGDYYVSCYYNTHRVWQHYHVEDIASILTTQGDLLVRGASAPERLAKGSDAQVLTMVSGSPAWATFSPDGYASYEYLQNSNDTEKSTVAGGYTKVKEIKFNETYSGANGGMRIKFELHASGATSYGRIYKNGVAIGAEHYTSLTDYQLYSEDLAFDLVVNDLLQIYAYTSSGSYPTYIKNFRLYYAAALTAGYARSVTNQDP